MGFEPGFDLEKLFKEPEFLGNFVLDNNRNHFYLVHKGDYDPNSFSDPKSGYGHFNGPALMSYVIGCLVQIPFMSTTLYVGSIAASTGAVDTSWIVGSIVTFFVYLAILKVWHKKSV